MSARMEQLVCRLVDDGRKLLAQPRQAALFAYNPAADAILNDIERYPQAFVLGCLANRMGKAKQAWKVPLRLRERFGTLDVAALAQKTEADWVRVARDPTPIHRRPKLMAKVLRLGVQRLQDCYDGDAARIWEGSPPSATVVRRFLEFHGAGPKIASMGANILVSQFKVPLRDYYFVDISVDVQVRRVMTRLGFVPEGASEELLICAAPRSALGVSWHLRPGALENRQGRVHPNGATLWCLLARRVLRLCGSTQGCNLGTRRAATREIVLRMGGRASASEAGFQR
jgi:endonuclease III